MIGSASPAPRRARNWPARVWRRVERLGTDVHARVWLNNRATPDSPPVVLVHGLALSSRYMVPLGRRLADRYDVLAPDLPGFGRTRAARGQGYPGGTSPREMADQLLAWMDACGIGRATLFGDSLGAQVVADLAARFPRRVHRLILKGPTPDPRYRSFVKQFGRVMLNMAHEAPSMVALYQLEYGSNGVARMLQQLARLVHDPLEAKLVNITVPALVLRGQHDKSLSHEWAEEIARLLPDGRLVVLDGASHNVHHMAPALTAMVIHDFIKGGLDAGRLPPGRGDDRALWPVVDARHDPLAPPKPVSTFAHGLLDYAMAAAAVLLPVLVPCGRRTRRLLRLAAATGAANALMTDYELGAWRKLPMPVHLNVDACAGLEQLLAAALGLRGEPLPGRCAVAAMGACQLLAASTTVMPMGPAYLVNLNRGAAAAAAAAPAAMVPASSEA